MNPFTPIRGGAAWRATASNTEAVTSVHLLKGSEEVDSIEGQTGRSLGSTPERTSGLIREHLSLRLGMDVACSGRLQMQRLSPDPGNQSKRNGPLLARTGAHRSCPSRGRGCRLS